MVGGCVDADGVDDAADVPLDAVVVSARVVDIGAISVVELLTS